MTDANVRKALIAAASDFLVANATISTSAGDLTGLPTIDAANIAWENRNFKAFDKGLWTSVFYVPNRPEIRTIGPGGFDEISGFLQIDFNAPPDSGEKALVEWETKGRAYFHGGRFFVNGGQSVLVVSSGMSEGRIAENFYRKSFTVVFRSHLKRVVLT